MTKPGLPRPNARVDERDTMFARMERRPGTPAYDDYYRDDGTDALRPGLRLIDDRLRDMPALLAPGGRHYDAEYARATGETFDAIESIECDPALVERWAQRLRASTAPTDSLHDLVLELGGVASGCTELDPAFVYTHKGRFDADYGREVELDHPCALVFLVEMDHARMRCAPQAPTLYESSRQYYEAARISKIVAAVLRAAGFEAQAHYDANYDVILPPLAVSAGLGELGRNNILVADRFGSRVRIGAVTTDLELALDAPVSLGVDAFCRTCGKCARTCPSNALSEGPKEDVRGVPKWPTHVVRCYGYWRQAGTDCGICMAVCPFSHPNTLMHRTARALVKRFCFLHPLLARLDDWIYGAEWTPAPVTPDVAPPRAPHPPQAQ